MVSYLATATLAISLLTSTPQPPEWQSDYGKALEATRAGEQPLLVVLDEPKNEAEHLSPAYLSEGKIEGREFELLQPYRLCHVDVSTDYGKKVAEAFDAKKFPFTAIIDKTGSVVIFAKSGQIAADDWAKTLKKFESGDRPSSKAKHVSYKVMADPDSSAPAAANPANCQSCQRNKR